jgi:hypothetical protein
MAATQVLIAHPDLVEANSKVQVNIHIEAELSISAIMARRQVTGYLIDYVSDHLGGEAPVLVVDDKQFLWRVPVMLYLTSRGKIGKVGDIDVDSQTGQLLVSQSLIEELKTRAEYLATRSAS